MRITFFLLTLFNFAKRVTFFLWPKKKTQQQKLKKTATDLKKQQQILKKLGVKWIHRFLAAGVCGFSNV